MRNAKFILFAVFIFVVLPSFAQRKNISGNKNIQRQERNLADFAAVSSLGSINVYISRGPVALVVEADENVLPYIETEVSGGKLKISTSREVNIRNATMKVHISMPDLREANLAGSGSIRSTTALNSSGNFNAALTGSGNINLEIQATDIMAKIAGSGNLHLSGNAGELKLNLTGSGNYRGFDLRSKTAQIRIAGSGSAEVNSAEALDVQIGGSGGVRYKGSPKISTSITGSGRVSAFER